MNMNNPAIECIGLNKAFGNKPVLQNIHLSVEGDEIFALVGPNGAGKTTLLKIFTSLIIPTGGKALVCGHDVMRDPIQAKRKIGFVPSEERSFYWRLNGGQNLRFFASLHNIRGKERNSKIEAVLEAVGLEDKGNVPFKEYSSGMKQALCIARGMLHDPPVLLLDEPTRSLSPDVARRIRGLIHNKAKKEGKTILISSHNLTEVEELADRIAVLHQGTIKALGSLNDLKTQAGFSRSADMDTLFEYFTNGC
jgi:ABC-2 type transport system ATP-binding protein